MCKKLFICLILCNLLLTGCVLGARSGHGNMQSYDGVSTQYVADGQTLASQTALELARRYPPARTHLGLVKTDTPFGQNLETYLRSQGFILSTDGQRSPLQASYILDEIQGESLLTCYLQLRMSDGERFGIVHRLNAIIEAPSSTTPSILLEAPTAMPPMLEERPLAPQQSDMGSPVLASAANQQIPQTKYAAPPSYTVHTTSTATRVAQRNKVPVSDFCRWNDTQATSVLRKGHKVYLQEPITALTAEPVRPALMPVTPEIRTQSPAYAAPIPTVLPASASLEPLPVASPPIATSEAPIVEENTGEKAQASLPATEVLTWAITPGNLQAQISAWAAQANYQLIWKTQNDFEMESHARFQGDFLDAIRQLFTGLQRSGHALRVTLYQGNNVLEVSEE